MTPGSFDATTAREVVGDSHARVIEAKARADADAGAFDPPARADGTYMARWQAEMRRAVYLAQYSKRKARNERVASNRPSGHLGNDRLP